MAQTAGRGVAGVLPCIAPEDPISNRQRRPRGCTLLLPEPVTLQVKPMRRTRVRVSVRRGVVRVDLMPACSTWLPTADVRSHDHAVVWLQVSRGELHPNVLADPLLVHDDAASRPLIFEPAGEPSDKQVIGQAR